MICSTQTDGGNAALCREVRFCIENLRVTCIFKADTLFSSVEWTFVERAWLATNIQFCSSYTTMLSYEYLMTGGEPVGDEPHQLTGIMDSRSPITRWYTQYNGYKGITWARLCIHTQQPISRTHGRAVGVFRGIIKESELYRVFLTG